MLLGCLTSISLNAQNEGTSKKYPSLLWEISGNGLKKPSYLFGTMHVSEKVAFHLSDSFFIALKQVDAVGLESRPDEWLPQMKRLGLLDVGSYYQIGNYFNSAKSFEVEKGKLNTAKQGIAKEHYLLNSLLYRSSASNKNFEEQTYLDMFIFQTGMKMNKELVSMEDYETSLEYVSRSSQVAWNFDGETGDEFEPAEPRDYSGYGNGTSRLIEQIEEAYRRGDLDVLDSLELLAMPEYDQRNNMLYQRNYLMVDRAIEIMKAKSLFMAVGAAHLPGEEGIIELLRAQGYTLRPIMQNGRDEKSRKKYEAIQVFHDVEHFVSSDGIIEGDFPGPTMELGYQGDNGIIVCPDMVNGAYYLISRFPYHHTMFKESGDYVLERIDSFLYEFVPGDIIKKSVIEGENYKGYDILNKTRTGDYQRSWILVLPDELMVIKFSGRDDYAKTKQVKKFFKSLKIHVKSENWTTSKLNDLALQVDFPGPPTLNHLVNAEKRTLGRRDFFYSGDLGSNGYFALTHATSKDWNFFPDTAHMRFAMSSYIGDGEFKLESSRYVDTLGQVYLEWIGVLEKENIILRSTFSSGAVGVFGAVIRADEAEAHRFFSSIKKSPIAQPKYVNSIDSSVMAYYSAPVGGKATGMIERLMRRQVRNQSYFSSNIKHPYTGENIEISLSTPGNYEDLYDSSMFFKSVDKWNKSDDMDHILEVTETIQRGDYQSRDYFYTDTNSSDIIMFREMWSPFAVYRITLTYDAKKGRSGMADSILNSFVPFDSIPGRYLETRGKALFYQDLRSDDTLKIEKALNGFYEVEFEEEDMEELVQMLDTSVASKKLRVLLREEIGTTSSPASTAYYVRKYNEVGDTTSMQLKALEYIFNQETSESYAQGKKLLLKKTPFPKGGYELYALFRVIDDSLELAGTLLPELTSLLDYDEYKGKVWNLLAQLADSGVMDKGLNYDYDPILKQAKIEMRKAKNSAKEEGSGSNYTYYGGGATESNSELKALIHALYPLRKTNEEVKVLIKDAKELSDMKMVFDVLKLQYEKDSTLDTTVVNRIAEKEKERFELYAWLYETDQLEYFPKVYNSPDSLRMALIYNLTDENIDPKKDSIVWLKKDLVIMGGDTGYLQYFRIYNTYSKSWNYVSLGLILKDGRIDPSRTNYFAKHGKWTEKDDEDAKISRFSEELAIENYRRFPGKEYSSVYRNGRMKGNNYERIQSYGDY